MLRALLWTLGIVAGSIALGCVARTSLTPWRRELANRGLDERVTVDLDGVGTAALPPAFRKVGIVSSGTRTWLGGGTTNLEYHLDERRITFRFVKGQHNTWGGYSTDPVLLDVTLYAERVPATEIGRVTSTTIGRFYPQTDDASELAARFAAARWLPEPVAAETRKRDGDAVTRAAPDDDMYDAAHPARWLVVHADPARRVRVDLYAWQSAYTLDEARRLVRAVAAGVAAAPALQAHFDDIPDFDRRMAERHDRAVADAASALAGCGVARLTPGEITWGPACAAHLSADRRELRVVRVLGRVPRAATAPGLEGRHPPQYRLVQRLDWQPRDADALYDLGTGMVYWDAATGRWEMYGLQSYLYDREEREHPLAAAVLGRFADREGVYVVRFSGYDLKFHADRSDVREFLAESARQEGALRAGKLVAGVAGTAGGW
jgi:hypothetical protein